VLLVMFASSESHAFRSAADVPDFATSNAVAFANPSVNVELFEQIPSDLAPAAVDLAIRQAAETWTAAGCTGLQLSYAGRTSIAAAAGDGRNTIQWVSGWKERGFPRQAPGLTDVQYLKNANGNWIIAEADIYLNLDFDWSTDAPTAQRKSVLAVLTHELGHLIGLMHVCEPNGSDGAPVCADSAQFNGEVMYPIYSASQTVLTDDDLAGVCFLYPEQVATPVVPAGPSEGCNEPSCVGRACSTDSDCGQREFCDGKVCARGEAALGDPCSSAAQCSYGACYQGVCSVPCSSTALCPDASICDSNAGACADSLAPMGASCSYANDCRGGYCLAQTGHAAECTRACAIGDSACPAGWTCKRVEDTPVCAPSATSVAGGCSIGPTSSSRSCAFLFALCAASIVSRRIRRHSSRTRL